MRSGTRQPATTGTASGRVEAERPGQTQVDSFKPVSAHIRRDMLGFSAGVFAAVQGTNRIDGTVDLAVSVGLDEPADVGQLAAGSTVVALALASLRNRQRTRERSLELGSPSIPFVVRHIHTLSSLTSRTVPSYTGSVNSGQR